MKKFYVLLCGILASFAFAAEKTPAAVCQLKLDEPLVVNLPMTKVSVTASRDAIRFFFDCEEPNMEYIKRHYSVSQWNLFNGEMLDLYFSPYGGYPNYRLIINPSNYFFQSFNGNGKWRNRGIASKIEKYDGNWTAEITIPYAALEDDDTDKIGAAEKHPYTFRTKWKVNFSRVRRVGGSKEVFLWDETADMGAKGVSYIILPQEIRADCPRVCIQDMQATTPDMKGKATCTFRLLVPEMYRAFSGKIRLVLAVDAQRINLFEEEVKLQPGQSRDFTLPLTLPEHTANFFCNLEVENAKGRLVRISRNVALPNPWVE